MNPKRKQKLYLVLFIVICSASAVGLALFALDENIDLFFTPTQIAEGQVPSGQRIRAGGMVEAGSVVRDENSLKVTFNVTDFNNKVQVEYTGILPDLFREGQGIVAQGRLTDAGVFEAAEVLAKHDENYMSIEVQEALEAAGRNADGSYVEEGKKAQSL